MIPQRMISLHAFRPQTLFATNLFPLKSPFGGVRIYHCISSTHREKRNKKRNGIKLFKWFCPDLSTTHSTLPPIAFTRFQFYANLNML